MNARITLVGTERHLNANDKSIADAWTLTNNTFDKDTFLACLINKAGQFEPLFSNPFYFRDMCGWWWNKWTRTFTKWFDVFDKEYEPLWDRNGFETVHEDTHEVLDNDTTFERKSNAKEVVDDDYSSTETIDTDSTTENQVSAYDKDTYQPHDKSMLDSYVTDTTNGSDDKTTTNQFGENGSGTNDSDNDKDFDRDYHSWGNWGISQTSQKLLESELKVQYWNCYEHMADIFCDEMLVRVY